MLMFFFASLLFSLSSLVSADNDSLVRHTLSSRAFYQAAFDIKWMLEICVVSSSQCLPYLPEGPQKLQHGIVLFTRAPQLPAHLKHPYIRPHVRVILPRDRAAELVNRPSLPSSLPRPPPSPQPSSPSSPSSAAVYTECVYAEDGAGFEDPLD